MGSFLNVVSLRFNTGKTVGGRSKCMTCGKQLTWVELVPVFSFLLQKGACRGCKSKISWQYPLVEFFSGAIFVLIFLVFPPTTPLLAVRTLIYVIITCLLVVISVYDIKHKIIPDNFSCAFSILALASLFIGVSSWFHMPTIWAILAGPILSLPFFALSYFSNGTWMGWGDGKLVIGIGWLLGIGGGINAIILAFWIAAVVSVIWLLATRKKIKPRTEVPFGPYLILGMYIVLLFEVQVIDINMLGEILTSIPYLFGV